MRFSSSFSLCLFFCLLLLTHAHRYGCLVDESGGEWFPCLFCFCLPLLAVLTCVSSRLAGWGQAVSGVPFVSFSFSPACSSFHSADSCHVCVPHLMTWMLRQAVSGVFRISLSSSSSFFLPLPLTHTFAPGTRLTATGCRMSVCDLPPHLVSLSLCLSFVMLKRAFYVGLVSRVTGCE